MMLPMQAKIQEIQHDAIEKLKASDAKAGAGSGAAADPKADGKTKFFGDGYEFIPGKDEVIVEGSAGYVVSFGEMLYRAYDAVLRAREAGIDVGLINKPSLHSRNVSPSFSASVFSSSSSTSSAPTARVIRCCAG